MIMALRDLIYGQGRESKVTGFAAVWDGERETCCLCVFEARVPIRNALAFFLYVIPNMGVTET